MSDQSLKLALRNNILQWQKKYGVVDGDPILACLELFEIYFTAIQPRGEGSRPATFEEFRSSLELLDQRGKAFTKQAAEVINEMRAVPELGRKIRSIHLSALFLTAVAAAVSGFLIGRFLPWP